MCIFKKLKERKKRKQEAAEETSQEEEAFQEYAGSLTFQELEKLNNDLYQICGEMHENKDFLNNPVLKRVMWKEITKTYIAKSKEIKEEREASQAIKRFISLERRALLKPDLELKRRFPWRKYGWNAIAEQCFKQANIEAAMEFSAMEEEIARQEEFLYGSPSEAKELISVFAETLPKRLREKWFKQNGGYISRILDVFMLQTKQNAERAALKALEKARAEEAAQQPAEATESAVEPTEEEAAEEIPEPEEEGAEDEQDEYADLEELEEDFDEGSEDDIDAEEPEEEPEPEEPVQEEIQMPPADDAPMLTWVPQEAAVPTEEETGETANDIDENQND